MTFLEVGHHYALSRQTVCQSNWFSKTSCTPLRVPWDLPQGLLILQASYEEWHFLYFWLKLDDKLDIKSVPVSKMIKKFLKLSFFNFIRLRKWLKIITSTQYNPKFLLTKQNSYLSCHTDYIKECSDQSMHAKLKHRNAKQTTINHACIASDCMLEIKFSKHINQSVSRTFSESQKPISNSVHNQKNFPFIGV